MKRVFLTVLTTVFFGSFLGKAQQTISNTNVNSPVNPSTTPANLSQFEVDGRALTQNSQNTPTGAQITGSFDPAARWNTMGNIPNFPASGDIFNGYRTQTDGRTLLLGHSIPNGGSLGNSFVEWLGTTTSSTVLPGNLEFKYAPTSTGTRVPVFTMAAANAGGTLGPFSYAEPDAFVGQYQSGTLGGFGGNDTWSGTGQTLVTGGITNYGSTHQYRGVTASLGNIEVPFGSPSTQIKSVLDYGCFLPAIAASITGIFQFRAIVDPSTPSTIKNVWQSGNNFGNVLFGRQDYGSVTSSNFYVSLLDGVASAPSTTALNFIEKAGIYATGDGLDQNNGSAQLNSYAAIVGDVSGVSLAGGVSSKYGLLGIADGNYSGGSSTARWAGYFIGNVGYTGSLVSISDEKFKRDVNKEENIMPRLMQLQPKNYLFDVEKNKSMAFSDKLQHGLISQEVEKVFPELVVDAFAPNTSKDKNEDGKPVGYKGLNYMGLISMLVKGIQEQQVQIDELKNELETVTSSTLVLNDKTNLPAEIQNKAFVLSQNVPNPFSENTTISYTIPATAGKAILAVFDLNGKMLLQYNLQQGKNTIVVKGNTLTAGMYLYSLIADGQEVLSKKMVLTK